MVEKRKRGRPQGSGKNDDPTLMRVARKLVRDTSLKPTTAMWRVISERRDWPETDETLLRRLQVKWRTCSEDYLARARREMEAPAKLATVADVISAWRSIQNKQLDLTPMAAAFRDFDEKIRGFSRGWQQLAASPEITRAIEGLKTFDDRLRLAMNSPEMKRVIENFQAFDQRWREIARSPEIEKWSRIAAQINLPQYTIAPEVLALSKPYDPTK